MLRRRQAALLLIIIVIAFCSGTFFTKYFPGSRVQNCTDCSIPYASTSALSGSINVNASNVLFPVNKLDYGANMAILWEKGMFVGGNMIHDSSFEGVDTKGAGIPDGWWPNQYGTITVLFSQDSTTQVSGKYSEKVQITSLTNVSMAGPVQTSLFVKRGHTYEVSFYARESGTSGKVVVQVRYDHPPWTGLSRNPINITDKWAKYAVHFTSPETTSAQISIQFGEVGTMWVDDVTMVDVNVAGVSVDPAILRKIQTVGPTLLRFPGGGTSDTYSWKLDVGPNYGGSWSFDRFMLAVQALNATPVITVNYGTGSVQEAADWVAYANAPSDGSNRWGMLRAANGHPAPYNVHYWEIGNEVYDRNVAGVTYAKDFVNYAQAMKTVDSTIKVGADMPESINNADMVTSWAKPVLTIAGGYVDFIIHHRYYPRLPYSSDIYYDGALSLDLYYGTMAATYDLQTRHQEYLNLIEQVLPEKAGKIPIAVTEYNAFYDYDPPRGATLEAGLLVADYLRYFASHNYISMVAIWDLINQPNVPPNGYPFSIINNFRSLTTRPAGYAFEMFTNHFGDTLVSATVNSPTFNVTQQIAFVQPAKNVPYLATVASVSNNTLYLIVINKHHSSNMQTTITINGFIPQRNAQIYTLNGPSIDSNNERVPDTVNITRSTLHDVSSRFTYTFPAHSVTAIELTKGNSASAQSVTIRTWTPFGEEEITSIEREILLSDSLQGWFTLTEPDQTSWHNFASSTATVSL